MTEKDLIRALSSSVADVRLSPSAKARIREQTNKGRQAQHKWRAGLVLAIALLLATAVAGAWSLSREFFEKTAELQFESGYYDDWSLHEKRGFVDIMAEYELLDSDAARNLKTLSEKDLDAWMADRYGIDGRTDVIGLVSVVETELGAMEHWSNDTWTWFNALELRIGQLSSKAPYICVIPGEEAVAPEVAIESAQKAGALSSGMSEAAFKAAQTYWTYEVLPKDAEREDARYFITFEFSDGSEGHAEVYRDGTVATVYGTWTTPEEYEAIEWETTHFDAYVQLWVRYAEEHGLDLSDDHRWPLEDKKALADLQEPIVKEALLANREELTPGELYQIIYGYGVPGEGVISQEEALEIASEALTEKFGLSQEVAAYYLRQEIWVDYLTRNASDEGHPVWSVFYWYTDRAELEVLGLGDDDYSVGMRIDAVTGEVLSDSLLPYGVGDDPKVQAVQKLLDKKGAPANWTDEEWNEYLPWPRE